MPPGPWKRLFTHIHSFGYHGGFQNGTLVADMGACCISDFFLFSLFIFSIIIYLYIQRPNVSVHGNVSLFEVHVLSVI